MDVKRVINVLSRKESKLFITLFIIYVFFINWYGWNEESNLSLTKSIVEENRLEIDSFHNLTGDRSVYQGHYYSDKSPGISFLATPVYGTWKLIYYNLFPKRFVKTHESSSDYITTFHDSVPIFTYIDPGFFGLNAMFLVTAFTSSIFTALTAVLIYKMSKNIVKNENYRIVVTFAYGLGTLAFPYALHFMNHAASAFFSFFSFYLLYKMVKKDAGAKVASNSKRFLLAGVLIGFAAVVEPLLILTISLLLIYSLLGTKKEYYCIKFLMFLLGLIIGISPLVIYNYTIFGDPLQFASSYIDRELYKSAYANFKSTNYYQVTEITKQQFVKYSFVSSLDWVFKKFHLIPSFNPYVFIRLLFFPYRGLVFYSPILLLSFLGLYWMFKKRKLEAIIIVLMLISFLFVISMRSNWWGGYCFGNRYLTPVVPFLIVPLLYAFDRIKSKLLFILILSLVVLSIFINFLGLQPAEDLAYDWGFMRMRSDWLEKLNSFQVFYNPLAEHYWPSFWETGPRSPLFENVVNGHFAIDVRTPALSHSVDFPFSEFHIPFLCTIPLFAVVFLIWLKEIKIFLSCIWKRSRT